MVVNLKGRDYLTLADFSAEEIQYLIDLSFDLKKRSKLGDRPPILQGKTLGMIFQKASTRTRVSFEVGMYQLGGYALFLSSSDLQIGRGEPIQDTARVLSRYLDGIMIRTFSHQEVIDLSAFADIPVINGLTDSFHPTQALADLLTIYEHKSKIKGLKMVYVGDGNNMAHSLLIAGGKMGMEVVIASPKGYEPQEDVVNLAKEAARVSGGKITIVNDPLVAVKNADVLYTDVWSSMGQEGEAEKRKEAFKGYQINEECLKLANDEAIVLHCLPAHRGEEITNEVIEGPQSVVFDEAENRLHAHKGILAAIL